MLDIPSSHTLILLKNSWDTILLTRIKHWKNKNLPFLNAIVHSQYPTSTFFFIIFLSFFFCCYYCYYYCTLFFLNTICTLLLLSLYQKKSFHSVVVGLNMLKNEIPQKTNTIPWPLPFEYSMNIWIYTQTRWYFPSESLLANAITNDYKLDVSSIIILCFNSCLCV